MKTLLLSTLAALLTLTSLSAQTLYQDALTLAQILRNEQNAERSFSAAEPPKLVLMKERKGVRCVYSEDAPTAAAAVNSGLFVSIGQAALDDGSAAVKNNQKKLGDHGYYSLHKLEPTDTVYVQLASQSVKLYFSDTLLVIEHPQGEAAKLAYDSILVLHHTSDVLNIYGQEQGHSIGIPREGRRQGEVSDRKIMLRPEGWHIPPEGGFMMANKEGSRSQAHLATNELLLKDSTTYSIGGPAWPDHFFHIKQGEYFLSGEYEPFGMEKQREVFYDAKNKQVKAYLKQDTTSQRAYHTRELREMASILATHQHFQDKAPEDNNLIDETFAAYERNLLLRKRLRDYLSARRSNLDSLAQSNLGLQLEATYEQNYPWKKVLYEKQGLSLEQKISYQDLTAAYRTPRPPAAQGLQQSSADLESKRKRLGGGINASAIAAGLSDFIVERAQDELNMTFMNRMKENITGKFPEFGILFPHTLTLLTNFQVQQYRSFLGFSKTAFQADLNNLGITFPRLFDLPNYQLLADDPNVYNISLIYDLANKIYEDTPADSVMLHLYTRLEERLDDLDDRVLRTLSGELLAEKKELEEKNKRSGKKKEYSGAGQKAIPAKNTEANKTPVKAAEDDSQLDILRRIAGELFQEIYHFDLMTELGMHNITKFKMNRLNQKAAGLVERWKAEQGKASTIFNSGLAAPELRLLLDSSSVKTPYYDNIQPANIGGNEPLRHQGPSGSDSAKVRVIGTHQIRLPKLPGPVQQARMDSALVFSSEYDYQGPIRELKKYELLIPKALNGEVLYEYQLKKLSYRQFDEYFREAPADSILVMEGISLLREFLDGGQLASRRDQISKLTKRTNELLPQLIKIKNEEQQKEYSPVVIAAARAAKQNDDINRILDHRIESLEAKANSKKFNEDIKSRFELATMFFDGLKLDIKKDIIFGIINGLKRLYGDNLSNIVLIDAPGEIKFENLPLKASYEYKLRRSVRKSKRNKEKLKLKITTIDSDNRPASTSAEDKITGLLVERINSIEAAMEKNNTREEVESIMKKYGGEKVKENIENGKVAGAVQAVLTKEIRKLKRGEPAPDIEAQIQDALEEHTYLLAPDKIDSLARIDIRRALDTVLLRKAATIRKQNIQEEVSNLLKPYYRNVLGKKDITEGNMIGRYIETGAMPDWDTIAAEETYSRRSEINESLGELFDQQLNKLGLREKGEGLEENYSRSLIHSAYALRFLQDTLNAKSREIAALATNNGDGYRGNALNNQEEQQLTGLTKEYGQLLEKIIQELKRIDKKYNFSIYGHMQYQYPIPTQAEIDELLGQIRQDTSVSSSKRDSLLHPNYYTTASSLQDRYRKDKKGERIHDVEYLERQRQAKLIVVQETHDYITYFEGLSSANNAMSLWLDNIEARFNSLSTHLDTLEAHYAERAFNARRQAQGLHTITEIGIHLLDAFKNGSAEMDSIVLLETVPQTVTVKKDSITATYTSTDTKATTLEKGRHVKKWITREQFSQIMSDSLTRDIYLGLIYQRLSNIEAAGNLTPEGIALVTTKLIGTVYDIDELRARLRKQKKEGAGLSFKDYYPFVRSSVDFLNILIETPIGSRPFSGRHKGLRNFSKISDQSLSLFENIFAKNYGESIQNLINLFVYIWDVDIEEAQSEQRLIQALPLLSKQGRATASMKKKADEYKKSSKRFQKALLVYGNFMAEIVAASDANAVKTALAAAAVPPGSSSVKRTAEFNLSLNSYFGGGAYREVLSSNDLPEGTENTATTVGLSVPVGFTATFGSGGPKNWSYSLFLPILDLGVVTAYRIDAQNAGQSEELPELSFSNLIAPGAYFIVNVPRSPFSIGAGAQLGPQLRKITTENGAEFNASAWRYGLTATIDVPVFTLFNR